MAEFKLNTICLDEEEHRVPVLTHTSEVVMQAGYWTRICRQLYAISEAVNVESNTQFIRLSVDSEVGNGAVQINKTSGKEERPMD